MTRLPEADNCTGVFRDANSLEGVTSTCNVPARTLSATVVNGVSIKPLKFSDTPGTGVPACVGSPAIVTVTPLTALFVGFPVEESILAR